MPDRPKKPRKPRLTERVLAGINAAISHMECDDLTDQTPAEAAAFEAARAWLEKMAEYRLARKRSR